MPDPAQVGWDQHFGYGLPDLGPRARADRRGQDPAAGADHLARVVRAAERQPAGDRRHRARALSAKRAAGYTYRLQWAPGIEPAEADFQDGRTCRRARRRSTASLGTIDLTAVRAALDARAERRRDRRPDRALQGPRRQGPERARLHRARRRHRHRRQPRRGPQDAVRLPRRDAARGLRRRTSAPAARRRSACSTSNGDNALDTVLADSSGELQRAATPTARRSRASTAASRCARASTRTCTPARQSYGAVDPPREVLRTPAIGDIDGDLEPEIVDSAGEHVYAWDADGSAVPGFPVRLDPALSLPAGPHAQQPHQARLHRLARARRPERGRRPRDRRRRRSTSTSTPGTASGNPLPGFPKKLRDPTHPRRRDHHHRRRSATSPATASPTSSRPPRSSTTTRPRPRPRAAARRAASRNILTNILANVLGGSGRVYALDRNGNVLPGWPTAPNGIVPDALPFVGPGRGPRPRERRHRPRARGDRQRRDRRRDRHQRRRLERRRSTTPSRRAASTSTSRRCINLFENPIAANIDGVAGPGDHQGRRDAQPAREPRRRRSARTCPTTTSCRPGTAQTGASLPTFPQAVEDFQLLSSPAVADVSDAPGNEVVVGTGLYYLRNINVAGVEGTGWPKFTGGWIFATPGDRRRGRRRRPRGDDAHARGLRLHVGHRPARLRHQRRVVDLAPRRVEHRRLRHRQPAARHAAAACGFNPNGSTRRR